MSVNWLVDFIDVTKYKVKNILSAYHMKNFFTQIFSLSHVQTNSNRGKILKDLKLGFLTKGWSALADKIIIYSILLHAKTLTSSGGIMECIKIVFLVVFLFLVIIAQMADEILLMVCLLLRHQYLRNQVALLMIEYCRWQRQRHVDTTHTFGNFWL